MFEYVKGKVVSVETSSVILEKDNFAFNILVPNPYVYHENEEYKIYLYLDVKEDSLTLYGFEDKEKKELFLKLISVKGVGPKTALPMLATGSVSGIASAVETENLLYLKKFSKIGTKVASQMILDLKGKLGGFELNQNKSETELYETLKSLGYKDKEITKAVSRIDKNLSLEEQVKEALKFMIS